MKHFDLHGFRQDHPIRFNLSFNPMIVYLKNLLKKFQTSIAYANYNFIYLESS